MAVTSIIMVSISQLSDVPQANEVVSSAPNEPPEATTRPSNSTVYEPFPKVQQIPSEKASKIVKSYPELQSTDTENVYSVFGSVKAPPSVRRSLPSPSVNSNEVSPGQLSVRIVTSTVDDPPPLKTAISSASMVAIPAGSRSTVIS